MTSLRCTSTMVIPPSLQMPAGGKTTTDDGSLERCLGDAAELSELSSEKKLKTNILLNTT